MDVGTGDGRYVVKTAAADPSTLVVGIDANADRMGDGFERARKAKLGNALFAVANAGLLPGELDGVAGAVTVHFPWGSLLDGLLTGDSTLVANLARLLQPASSSLTIVLSVVENDHVPALDHLDEATAPIVLSRITSAAHGGLTAVECRRATPAEIAATHSTWAKRLRADRTRPVWLFRLVPSPPWTSLSWWAATRPLSQTA